ncbi:MAG: hypothetical protein IJ796_05185 [Lachnospiraceae bacterium]|nr:hypothetical protein [Lachnospiraceae bacterium]
MADQVMDSTGELKDAAKLMAATEKKCPSCGAALEFNAAVGKLKCPFCDTEVDIPEAEKPAQDAYKPRKKVGVGQVQKDGAAQETELDLKKLEQNGNRDWGTATKVFNCKYCGAEIVMDVNSLSTTCPYCGSNHVTEAADDAGTLSPGGVIPFKITQEQASELFRKWIGAKLFAPNAAKKSAKAESFQGIYLPYWTFDAQTETNYTGEYGINRTETYKDNEGNEQTRTVTDWYDTRGHHSEFIDDQLVCASKKHTESFLKSIEPFDTGDNKVYSPEYLSGFLAERYTLPLDEGWASASRQIEDHLHSVILREIEAENSADDSKINSMDVAFSKMTYKYLLLPIWMSSFTFNGKVFQFVVNGQTGKVGGKSPVSALKVTIAILIGVAIIILLACLRGCGD